MTPSSTPTRIQRLLNSRLANRLSFPHGVDAYLQAINPLWSTGEVRVRLLDVRCQTADSVTVTLQPNTNWAGFLAGQFVNLNVEIDGVQQSRCFSPANAANRNDLIELTCKINPDSVMSRYLRDRAQPGEIFGLSQAQGQFALPEQRPQRILLISGGSGITPVLSMLRTLCNEDYAGRITFLHYCRDSASQLYADELRDIAATHPQVELLRCYAEADQAGELQGLFSAAQLRQAAPDFAEAETFLCGPPALMERVSAVYAEAGAAERLHQEHFAAPAALPDPTDAEGELRFEHSERYASNSGATLLEQAEAAGLRPKAGCRMGICYSCTCRKTAGRVRDLRSGKLSETGAEDIQICVSVPVGTVAVDL